jgi:hypothetical protein
MHKIIKILLFILPLQINGQIGLWQLEWAPDSTYIIGASALGEPKWKIMDVDTQFLNPLVVENDTLGFYLSKAMDTVEFVIDTSSTNELQAISLDSSQTSIYKTYYIGLNPQTAPPTIKNIQIPLAGSGGTQFVELSSNFTTSTSLNIPFSGLNFSVNSGKKYLIKFIAKYQTTVNTTGCRIAWKSNNNHACVGNFSGSISSVAASNELKAPIDLISSSEILFSTTGVSAANSPTSLGSEFILKASANDVISLHFGSEVSGSAATLLSGSIILISLLN